MVDVTTKYRSYLQSGMVILSQYGTRHFHSFILVKPLFMQINTLSPELCFSIRLPVIVLIAGCHCLVIHYYMIS